MNGWIRSLLRLLIGHKEAIGAASAAVALTSTFLKLWPKIFLRWREETRKRKLRQKLNATDYTGQDLATATAYYISPQYQVVDPSGGEDFRRLYPVRQDLFEVVDDLLFKETAHRFSLILGDTGMGKTSFLLNYYARHWQSSRRRRRFPIRLVPLGRKSADADISDVMQKSDTVLFLDAFDEDVRAAGDHRARFFRIIENCSKFRHVLITCRTQFFARDDEIPREAGIIRVGPTGPGDSREFTINKLYLSPFSDEQIEEYIRRRFPLWHVAKRRSALAVIRKIEDLPARPMLLAQVEHILSLRGECRYPFQIYEQMIQVWLNREKGIADPVVLRDFCECLAVDIFVNRQRRGAEKITETELLPLAERFGVSLPKIEHIRARSLLNRDAEGNLKFAHRSIMEYLFIAKFRRSPLSCPQVEWTDQMKRFYWETSFHAWESDKVPMAPQAEADLSGLEQLRLKPVVLLRSRKQTMTLEQESQFNRFAKEQRTRIDRAPHFYRTIQNTPNPG